MADVYFGSDYSYNNNGNWTDVSQWYSQEGYWDYETFVDPVPLGRLPTQADKIIFKQYLRSNFPTSWSGDLVNPRLGYSSPRVNATGTWSGNLICDSATIYGTSTQPVFSGNISCSWSLSFYGGNITGSFSNTSGGYISLYEDTRYNGSTITFSNYLNFSLGGTTRVNASINSPNINLEMQENTTVNGTITSVGALNVYGATILNSPTITSNGNITIFPKQSSGAWTLPTTTTITGYGLVNLGRVVRPSVTTVLNIPSTVSFRCANKLTIDNCNMQGSFQFIGTDVARRLQIQNDSIVAQDISSAAINCYNYKLFSGTFTHPNDWVFGSPTTPAQIVMGCEESGYYNYSLGQYVYYQGVLNTSKNITIYSNNTTGVNINDPIYIYAVDRTADYYYNSRTGYFSTLTYGKFTGTLTWLPTTGFTGTLYGPAVGGGTYAPTATISAIKNGSTYNLDYATFPNAWRFGDSEASIFSPNVYVNNLPSDNDILATGGMR